jgi:hypothetical protein
MDENTPDWLLKAAQETDALIRKVLVIVRAAQQHVDEARADQAAAGPSLLSGHEVALAMDAGMRELFAAVRGRRNVSILAAVATAHASALAVSVAIGETGAATDTLTVQKEAQTDVGMPLDAKTVFLAIVWVFAILLPLKIGELPPEVQTIIRDFLVTIGTALIIHWRLQDGRKRD